MRLQLRSLVAAVALIFAASPFARAVDVIFNLSELPGQSSPQSLTSGGYTLLFTYIGTATFSGSSDGIALKSDRSFTISKTTGATDLLFKSYTNGIITNITGNNLSFNLTGGTGTSTGNTVTQNTPSNYNGSYSLVGSQTVSFNPVNFGGSGANKDNAIFSSLTFSTVPEPSTYALAAIATGVMAAVVRRRKARKA